VRTPRKKKLVAFGVDKSNSSGDWNWGYFRWEARGLFVEKKRMGGERAEGKG